MNYRLIVIGSSLKDTSILEKYKILSETKFEAGTPKESSMYKIEIPESEVSYVSNFLKNSLKNQYYAHLYSEGSEKNTVIVVFPRQIFTNLKEAVAYGVLQGIPEEQMDIKPTTILEEKW